MQLAFAVSWIDAWNARDIERILDHYDEFFEFSSPVLAKLNPASGGRLRGVVAARTYWSRALAANPGLHFELISAHSGVSSLVIHYRGYRDRVCAEFFTFAESGKVASSHAHEA